MGIKFVTDYYNRMKPFDQLTILGLETTDRMTLPDGNQWHVRIDKLACDKEGNYFVCDYKTNARMKDQEEADADRQLALYSIWVKDKFEDVKSVKLIWHMLAFDKDAVSERTDKQLEKLQQEIMNKIPEKLKELDQNLAHLARSPGFDNVQQVVNKVVGLLGVDVQDSWKLFSDSQGKIRSNAAWFMEAGGFADKRASYKITDSNNINIDAKAYWMKNLSKSITAWLVALTPNFEDEPFYKKEHIGIDFIIPEKADRVKVVLSKNYVIRTLELYEYLSVTQQGIFDKWLQDFDFENKERFATSCSRLIATNRRPARFFAKK